MHSTCEAFAARMHMGLSPAAPIPMLHANWLFDRSLAGQMERVVKRNAHDILLPVLFIERVGRRSLFEEPEPAVCADMGSEMASSGEICLLNLDGVA